MKRNVRGRAVGPTSKVGLALAGGGPEGAIYEIGVLCALEEAISGIDLNAMDVYVGVSAGAIVSANLANGLTARQMQRAIVKHEPGEHPFEPKIFYTLARREFGKRLSSVPKLVWQALADFARDSRDLSLRGSLRRLARALPVGVFDNEPIRAYQERTFSIKGRTNDFRELGGRLVVVAADLDSGQAVRFGEPPFDDIPISTAIQASTALPGLYTPVVINGRHYVDGVLLKTLHGSVALERGTDLLLCVNPIVPVDTSDAVEQGVMRRGKLIDRGLPSVLSQSLRTLVHSRLEAGIGAYDEKFEDADLLLLEPEREDYRMFFTNIFSFSRRQAVCEHAYAATRRQLLERYDKWAPILERHGLWLDRDVLEEQRVLWPAVEETPAPSVRPGSRVAADLDSALDRLDSLLAEA